MRKLLLLALILFAQSASAQVSSNPVRYTSGVPSACTRGRLYVNYLTGDVYSSNAGACKLVGNTGTVTGTGAAGRLALWSSASALTSDTGLTFDGTNNDLTIGRDVGVGRQIIFSGSTSGFVNLKAPATPATYTLTLPTNDGDADQFLKTDGSGVLSWANSGAAALTWTAATLQNSWTNTGGVHTTVSYTKDTNFVYLKGLASPGTTAEGTTVFTLPAGYRPAAYIILTATATGGEHLSLQVDTGGEVKIAKSGGHASNISFSGLMFPLN